MTTEELVECFKKYGDADYLKFHLVSNPRHRRADLCAFLMLTEAVDSKNTNPELDDLVSDADDDEIFLSIVIDQLAEAASEGLIRDLIRCGVMYSEEYDCLSMFT